MTDRAEYIAQEFVPTGATKIMVDTRSGDRQVYSAEEWQEHIAAALRDFAEEARREERDVAATDAEMRYEDGYACGVKDEREACAQVVPQNWCDPLLSGPAAALSSNGPWGCPDIERLLNRIVAAIRARGEGKG